MSSSNYFVRFCGCPIKPVRATSQPTFLDQRGPVAFNDSRHVLQPPGRATSGPQRFAVQCCRDPSYRVAALAQVTDFGEHTLLSGVWFDVLPVRAETESEPDIPEALPLVR